MKKSMKILTSGLIATALVIPNLAFAYDNTDNNSNIKIDLEKKSVMLGDTSKISISFKEKQNANSITVNFLCYDKKLSANLNYNPQTNAYEGEIKFNIDPEYLNVWEIENIVVNSDENTQTLDKNKLTELGIKLDEYKITQEYIITKQLPIKRYMEITSAPVEKLAGTTAFDTAVSISKKGWSTGSKKVIIVNGDIIADGITATPLASTYDAPILIVKKDSVPQVIKDELKRLNPEEIIVIGGEYTISNSVYQTLASNTGSQISRIYGKDRNETSLKIAQAIDANHDVNKVFIANGFKGDIDALSIAAKAGQDKQPVILTEKTTIPTNTYTWLKNEGLTNAYFIGGPATLDTEIIHKMAEITTLPSGQSVYYNRVYGADRHETNAKVIAKFYPQSNLNSVLVARSDVLTDALIAGPLASKLSSPILINPTSYVSSYHEDNLTNKSASVVYKIGNDISDSVINDIAYKLSPHNSGAKTVVIDPGHGGEDPGASNIVNPAIKEKDYTLDTSLAAAQYLRDNGVNVLLTRDIDKTLDYSQRTGLSNNIGADLFTSIHYNAAGTKGHGVEVWYKDADKNGGTSKTLATNILNSILNKFALTNRGIKTKTLSDGRDYYKVIRDTNAPAVIVECSFIDNEADQKLVNTLEKRQMMGTQIGKGIENTIN